MRISKKGIDLIKEFEGWSAIPYICSAGKKTIGYGHVMLPGENWTRLTTEEGLKLLDDDLDKFEAGVNKLVKVPLTQGQFDALVSFAFNVGLDDDLDTKAEGLGDSTLLKKVNAQDFDGAANEFGKWVFAAGKKLNGLVNRRAAEAKMFRGEA